jgi:AcrR family transcriptional regulator
MARRTRAHLTEDVIVAESMRLIAQSEAGDFTLNALAKRLGVSAPSLYSHVPSKQYIIERVRSRVVASIDPSSFATKPWPEALADWARSYAAAFAKHPETIPLLATNPVQSPDLVAQYEIVARALLEAGWPAGDVMAVITSVESLVLGSVLDIVAPVEMVQPDEGGYPTLERILATAPAASTRADDAFALGLDALITGLVARLRSVLS